MIEGRIAGTKAAQHLGFLSEDKAKETTKELELALDRLRKGMFAPENRGKKIALTDEGIPCFRKPF